MLRRRHSGRRRGAPGCRLKTARGPIRAMATQGTDTERSEVVSRPGTTLAVDPVFDVSAALKLREAIAQLPPAEPVVIDFTRTRECHNFALAALVHALATIGRTD